MKGRYIELIKSGYSGINESVSGELAVALKQMNASDKKKMMNRISSSGIDFNRSISQAQMITKSDTRLKVNGNIVIGVYHNEHNDKDEISAFKIGEKKPLYCTSLMIKINGKYIDGGLDKLSWKDWIACMKEIYIIDQDNKVSNVGLRNQRYDAKEMKTGNDAYTKKISEICDRYGFKLSVMNWDKFNDISVTKVKSEPNSESVDIRYNPKDGFTINTWSADRTEKEAEALIKNLQNALELIHKLNQVNPDKLTNTH